MSAKRPEAMILACLFDLLGEESPENLHEDGEASATRVARKAANIRRRRRDLFRELGRKVTEEELYAWIKTPEGRAAWEGPREPVIAEGPCDFCGLAPIVASYERARGKTPSGAQRVAHEA